MPPRYPSALRCEALETREVPAAIWVGDTFDNNSTSTPSGWKEWAGTNASSPTFAVDATAGYDSAKGIKVSSGNKVDARAWTSAILPADFGASVLVKADSTSPSGVVVRGALLGSTTPSMLSATVSSGAKVEFAETVNGRQTRFATLRAIDAPPTNVWLKVTLEPKGTNAVVRIQRMDTQQFLNATGNWQSAETEAIRSAVTWNPTSGVVGITKASRGTGAVALDNFAIVSPVSPTANFNSTTLPANWKTWATTTTANFKPTNNEFTSQGVSTATARAWLDTVLPGDVSASATVFADSLIATSLFVRGQNLESTTPTFLSATLTRGLTVTVEAMVNGNRTTLGSLKSTAYTSGQWVKMTLSAEGDAARLIVYRTDTKQWLNRSGTWQSSPDAALEVKTTVLGAGRAGVNRAAGNSGNIRVDDFVVGPVAGAGPVPKVEILQRSTANVSGEITFRATVTDKPAETRIEYILAGRVVTTSTQAPADFTLDTTSLANGIQTLTVRAIDSAGNAGTSTISFTVQNANPAPRPALPEVPRKFSHIRIAQLAYSGTPMTATEQNLLKTAVDLVIPATQYLSTINAASPSTPQLIYSNVSNLYLDLLGDWFEYAVKSNSNREAPFYHVTQATPFDGDSPSSIPVKYFWNVSQTGTTGKTIDLTAAARAGRTFGVNFGAMGTNTFVGHLDRFREMNLDFKTVAGASYTGTWEYVAAVDTNGNATQWKTLALSTDGTNMLKQNGRITFDPPADWQPSVNPGTSSARNYFVRFRTTAGSATNAPEARTVMGRDYVNANGTKVGIIPAFDKAADKDGDGYLNDAEYANRKSGFDARFVHETRLFYPYYGQMRFAVNPSPLAVRQWSADYHTRLLKANPLADGIFLDNSIGKVPTGTASVAEPTASYSADLGRLVESTWKAIAPKWILANTVSGGADADPVATGSSAVLEEFLLRPTEASWSTVLDVQALVNRRLNANNPSPYVILDSHPGTTSPTDPRTEIGALAYYYLLADAQKTMLMFFGGNNPSSSWNDHWTEAARVDVGQPQGAMSVFATGKDPANNALTYQVFGRDYGNALVLYKPRSYAQGQGTGTTADNTSTTHQLNGRYRAAQADGTLGPAVTQINLRNGEGAVLIKA